MSILSDPCASCGDRYGDHSLEELARCVESLSDALDEVWFRDELEKEWPGPSRSTPITLRRGALGRPTETVRGPTMASVL